MEAIHEKSHLDTHLPELVGLWSVPPTQTDIIKTYHQRVNVKGDLDNSNEIIFESGAEKDFIDLSESYIEIEIKVVCTAGSIIADDNLALTNLFAHGLFESIRLTDKSGRPLSNLNEQRYPYQAMLLTLLSKNYNWSKTAGQIEGFYADTPGQFDTSGAANTGFTARQALITATARDQPAPSVTVVLRPFIGIMKSKRLLLSDMNLRLSLTRSKPEFYLQSAAAVPGARAQITKAHWYLKRVQLTPAAENFNIEQISKERALYPIDRTLFYQQQEVNKTQFRMTDMWSGPLPSHLFLAIVRSSAFEGNITQNPYNFANFNLNSLQLTAGSLKVPENEFKPVFNGTNITNTSIAREYMGLLEVAGKAWGNDGNLIDIKNYVGGCAIYAFDLTADGSQGAHWSLAHRSELSITGSFANAPAHPITIIAIGMIPSVIEVGMDRSIITDFTE